MRSLRLWLPILLCLAAVPCFGQGILPNSFAGWTATSRQPFHLGTQPVANPQAATDQVAAAAAREYGFVGGETASYSRSSTPGAGKSANATPETLTATLYRMKDVSGAYGEYSYLRTPEMNPSDIAEHSSQKPDETLILIGNFVLDVQSPNAAHDAADIKALVATLSPEVRYGLLPGLPDHLPVASRVERTDHYILGPQTLDKFFPGAIGSSLGFSYGPEAETAQFHAKGHDVTLLIADFPTPQIAQSQLDRLKKQFNIDGSLPGASPAFFSHRSQTLLGLVAGAQSAEEAAPLLNQVKAGTVLTWSEPTFQFKEPPIEVMIVGAIVGTGVICMFALVAGVAFGGFRLVMKKLFPGKVFDRSAAMDVIQLGISSKPLKAEDFYGFDGKRIKGVKVDRKTPDRIALRIFK